MIDKIASQFGDTELLSKRLANSEPLRDLVFEFCHTFDVKATAYGDNERHAGVNVLSNRGIPLGNLRINRHDNEPIYIYECENIIQKDKASARSSQYARDSNKIRSLIKTIKNNKEMPCENKMVDSFKYAMRDAINNVADNGKPTLSVSSEMQTAMAETILGVPRTMSLDIDVIRARYEKYLTQLELSSHMNKEAKRYAKGCTVIRMPYGWGQSPQDNDGVLIGEARWDGFDEVKEIHITKQFERYDNLLESPIAGLATMIRTYFESRRNIYNKDNVLGLEFRDRYYKDIDISTASRNNTFVAIIPLHAE